MNSTLNQYKIGNHNLGLKLVIRNLNRTDNKLPIPYRYIRLIFTLIGTTTTLEFRFRNSL